MQIMQIVTNIAAVVGCITACITLAVAIIKPFRKWIIESFVRQSQSKELHDKVDNMNEKMDKLLDKNEKLETRVMCLENNVLENEADRIRSELFDCGNRCRRGIRLHPEEFEHMRSIYHKYSATLKQNGEGAAEMEFITDYYNHQTFPEYHKHN